ncbi:bacillithiol system redox-active protein YtxJ [Parvicella tangerina]|uniref:Bacillithiol system redox-active protein YtxJ n=1 Tax=Parvicella tangerina TaxID=2829795 RepID=A0A916JN95_9FLAO|nr:bacillithiol system redox-active protein YtxJ [Parvicella tangerina]CAG5083352.1 hypothetical protein CRYO30217_02171 [Parvicella tangerina]
MGWFKKSTSSDERQSINWRVLKDMEGLDMYNDLSFETPVVFFKHSTRCSISSMAKDRLERDWAYEKEEVIPVYLDLITYRDISNKLSELYGIDHESPQILLVKNGKCIHTSSHSSIDPKKLSLHIG